MPPRVPSLATLNHTGQYGPPLWYSQQRYGIYNAPAAARFHYQSGSAITPGTFQQMH